MPTPIPVIRIPPSMRRPFDTPSISSYYHLRNADVEEPSYRFAVLQEEDRRCRWRLPLWLLFFGVTVSMLTLLFLLTGTVYPVPGWSTRYGSRPLSILRVSGTGDFYRAGHPPSATNDSTPHPLAPVSYAEPYRILSRLTGSGNVIALSTTMRRPSTTGPASLVDNNLSLLVQVRIPDTPRDARCTITSGITLTRPLETAGKAARVQLWSLAGMTSDGRSGENEWPQREAHVSSFDVRPGEAPVQRSSEFACPASRSLQTFEVTCAGDDACSVEVWQGLFRVEIRA
ncbi:hypothetical protein F5148DRAFT_1288292 [Russula earlei]|uniref:Uncharacterized protein n=1 Tax=Russula earlei TaxID=71964 RepID=A0ACC0U1B1_9AGAM|nr:hypothetical protein F5148DRAFT_1288292 [Russula earlei]